MTGEGVTMKFDNRQLLRDLQAGDAARRAALMQRLSGKPEPVTADQKIKDLLAQLATALAVKGGDDESATD